MFRRLLIFGLLGPPLGLITGAWIILPLFHLALGTEGRIEGRQLTLLPLAYALGLVPALLTALADGALAPRGVGWRPVWTALMGFLTSLVPLLGTFFFLNSPFLLIWGLVGAVPGLVCSLLSGSCPRGFRVANPPAP